MAGGGTSLRRIPWWLSFLFPVMVASHPHVPVDQDHAACLAEKESLVLDQAQAAYDEVVSAGGVIAGTVNYADEAAVHLSYAVWTVGDGRIKAHAESLGLVTDQEGGFSETTEDWGKRKKESVEGMIDFAHHAATFRTAMLMMEGEEAYLTVNTSAAATSCTLRLSSHTDHGAVATNDVFKFLAFSPDGRFVAYTAERGEDDPEGVFPDGGTGSFNGMSRPPAVYLYDVEELEFHMLNISDHLLPGHLQWHTEENVLLGVAWEARELPTDAYSRTDIPNVLFAYVLEEEPNGFRILMGGDAGEECRRHFASPRVSPGGDSIVFLERNLCSSASSAASPTIYPGPNYLSAKLSLVEWEGVKGHLENGTSLDQSRRVVVNSLSRARQMEDHTHFYGLYPHSDVLPKRVFSQDGGVVYLTVRQLSDARLLAIDLATGEVVLHPEPGLLLLDVHQDVVLVGKTSMSHHVSEVAVARVHRDFLPTTTTTKQPDTTTTWKSSTEDPCETLQQEMEIDGRNTTADPENSTETTTPPPPSNFTTVSNENNHTKCNPGRLVLPRVNFVTISLPCAGPVYRSQVANFDLPSFRDPRFDGTFFTAWRAWPKDPAGSSIVSPLASSFNSSSPLLVYLKDGPHTSELRSRSLLFDFLLSVGFELLVVNHRGSTGAGDDVLHAIIGNVAEMDVSDTHEAIQRLCDGVSSHQEVVLMGQGYGGLVAAQLAARYPRTYRQMVLVEPVADLLALRHLGWILPNLLGRNYTDGQVEDEELVVDAWNRSPLSNVDKIKASSLIAVREDDQVAITPLQGERLYKALKARGVTAELFVMTKGFEVEVDPFRYGLPRVVTWLHRLWGVYDRQCGAKTTPTPSPSTATASTTKGTSGASRKRSGEAAALLTILVLPIFVYLF